MEKEVTKMEKIFKQLNCKIEADKQGVFYLTRPMAPSTPAEEFPNREELEVYCKDYYGISFFSKIMDALDNYELGFE